MTKTTYQEPHAFFEGSTEFINYLENTPRAPDWANGRGEAGRKPDSQDYGNAPSKSWDDYTGYFKAMSYAKNGWPEGVKLLSEAMELDSGQGKTPRRIHDVGGDFPDVGRYLAGRPDCMTRRVIQQGHRRPIITLEMGCTFSAMVDSRHIMNLGAGVATLADTLEEQGFRVAINVYWSTIASEIKTSATVQVKKPDQALNMSDLIFFLAHPAALRRLAFHYWETVYSARDWPSGYGSPHPKGTTTEQKEDPCFIHFNDLNSQVHRMKTTKDAIEYVQKILKEQSPTLLSQDEAQAA